MAPYDADIVTSSLMMLILLPGPFPRLARPTSLTRRMNCTTNLTALEAEEEVIAAAAANLATTGHNRLATLLLATSVENYSWTTYS